MIRLFWIWTSYWFNDDGHHYQEIQAGMGFILSLVFVFIIGYLIYLGKLLLDVQDKQLLIKKAQKKRFNIQLPRLSKAS